MGIKLPKALLNYKEYRKTLQKYVFNRSGSQNSMNLSKLFHRERVGPKRKVYKRLYYNWFSGFCDFRDQSVIEWVLTFAYWYID